MLRYESLFITVPEITADEAGGAEKTLQKAVTDSKGSVISFERWGKFQLSYPIRRNDYGVYYLMRFEVSDDQKDTVLAELKKLFSVKFGDLIMRSVVKALPAKRSLDYKRPDSLEETPTKDIDTIMKESKNLLRRDRPYRDDSAPRGDRSYSNDRGGRESSGRDSSDRYQQDSRD